MHVKDPRLRSAPIYSEFGIDDTSYLVVVDKLQQLLGSGQVMQYRISGIEQDEDDFARYGILDQMVSDHGHQFI